MMLKATKKGSLGSNLGIIKLQQKRDLKTKRLLQGVGRIDQKRESMYDIQASLQAGVGIVRMNREHRFNTLTPGFVKQVSRGIETMYLDHSVSVVYLTTAQGEQFSNGTDFRTILHYKTANEDEKIANYLESIYKLQTTFAKCNKPIMTVAPGHSFNSGATMLAASGFPSICHDTKISFNECSFGYVPHAGTSYYASRMPGDFGTFLTLTGMSMSGKDAIKIGLAEALIEEPSTYEHEVADILNAMDPSSAPYAQLVNGYHATGIDAHNPVDAQGFKVQSQIERTRINDTSELRTRLGQNQHDELFVDPRKRRPDLVAEADLKYKSLLQTYAQAKHGHGGSGYFDPEAQSFNQYEYYLSFLRMNAGHVYAEETVKSLLQHRQLIDRCFWPDSLEEITDNLRRESHPFAKQVLSKMESNSELSMKLALKMIRNAQNLAYGETLAMELNVALNKVNDTDFKLGVEEILMKPSRTPRLVGRSNPGFQTDVSDSQVDSYFEENKWAKNIDLDIVENSLLPTRHFFEKFSDSVRVWINESSTPQADVREAIELEVKEILRAEGIDVRDKTVTVPMARDYLNRKVMQVRKFEAMNIRASQLMSDKKLRTWYYDSINTELNKLTQDPKGFYKVVNKNIQQIFESAYLERLATVHSKSRDAQSLEKRRMYIRLKKFLVKSRVLGYRGQETERMFQQIEALPFKQIHMTEHWEESFRDLEHPELSKSVMYHLSKVVGKTVLAPPAMAKTYLTDPEAAKALTAYTFDKVELEKLRKDLIENPTKYEEMLKRETVDDGFLEGRDPGSWSKAFDERAERREYWYRLYNDGKCDTLDNWPMRAEYFTYKHWADSIQDKAYDTLSYTVSRLLLDFENDKEVGNKVDNFSNEEKGSSRASLERICEMLNERKDQQPVKTDTKKIEELSLKDTKRAANQIKKDFYQIIEKDNQLSSLFGVKKEVGKNSLITNFREELLNELLQLVEAVLIQQKSEIGMVQLDKDVLEKRLATILSPQNTRKDKTSQLAIVDAYLADKHGKQAIIEAINMVQPFFIQICKEKLDQESQRVLQGFDQDVNSDKILEFFVFNLANPKSLQSRTMEKVYNHHHGRFETQPPQTGKRFSERAILSSLGGELNQGLESLVSLADKEKAITEAAQKDQRGVSEFLRQQALTEEAIQEELQDRKDQELRVPFDEELSDGDQELDELAASLDQDDIDYLDILAKNLGETRDYLAKHQYELRTLLSEEDWLHIYSKSLKDFNLNMDQLTRRTQHPEAYLESLEKGDLPIDQMRKRLGEDQTLNWQQLGNYAEYLKGFYKAAADISQKTNTAEDSEKMLDFMVSQDKREMDSANLSRESLFRSISDARMDPKSAKTREDSLRQEINSFSSLHQKITNNSQKSLECLRLAKFAPQDIREDIHAILSSESKHVDHRALINYLNRREWKKPIEAKDFIDKQKLLKEFHNGSILKEFINKYKDVKLDVVSLAEIKSLLQAANTEQKTKMVDQIQIVLDHVDEQMRYVSHDRRQEITLGDFMSRNHYLNASSYRHYSSDLLKNQIENALGRIESQEDSAAAVEWEFNGVNINPKPHENGEFDQDQIHELSRKDETVYYNKKNPATLQVLDESTGMVKQSFESEVHLESIYNQAKMSTVISPSMVALKNMYENQLLAEYTNAEYDVQKTEALIEAYTFARLKECHLNTDFSSAMKSPHAHIYLKTLRQRVMEELSLDQDSTLDQFSWEKLPEQQEGVPMDYDAGARYNLHHLNNEKSIGYNDFEKRAENVDNLKDAAHDTVFDKMLADFFLQKRGDYKKGNKLQSDLEAFFEENFENKEQQSKKAAEFGHPNTAQGDPNSLGFHYMTQSINKDDQLALIPSNFPALLELDVTVNRRLNNNKSGLSKDLRHLEKEDCVIPDYFEYNDVRKPADTYVKDKLMNIMVNLFSSRRSLEKHLSRRELLAYDQVMAKYLEYDLLTEKLKREIYKDYNDLEQMNQVHNMNRDNQRSDEKQTRKSRNMQGLFNKEIVNEDAFYKLMAYTGLLEKKRRENHKQTMADPVLESGAHSFETFYQDELFEDSKRPERTIDPQMFKSKKNSERVGGSDRQGLGYQDLTQKRDFWLEEHKQYKENKLEQQQRIETFYLLEQFFENQKKPDSNQVQNEDLYQAQNHIKDYFREPENTYFFDKNKID